MKKIIVIALFFLSEFAYSQNLVPNWSFEDTVACPTSLTQINNALGWSSCRITPDYFNACSSPILLPSVSVPTNQWGSQEARTGNAYAGIITFQIAATNSHEAMTIQLIQPLIVGQRYYASFYISRAVTPHPYLNIANNKLGMRFSTIQYSVTNPCPIDNYAQIYSDSIITDTLNWVRINGSFIADSAYQFLSIGNFFDDALTSFIRFDTSSGAGYYYIDDIAVSIDSNCCSNISTFDESKIKVFPNPCLTEDLIIEGSNIQSVEVMDIYGKILRPNLIFNETDIYKLYVGDLYEGIYFVNIKINNFLIRKTILKLN